MIFLCHSTYLDNLVHIYDCNDGSVVDMYNFDISANTVDFTYTSCLN